MANSFNVHSVIAKMAMYFLENELVLGNKVHRGYEKEWEDNPRGGHKIGSSITIDRPPRFRAIDGPDITGALQDVVYGSATLQLNIQKTVPFQFDARGLTTEADVRRVGSEAVRTAASEIAEAIETTIAGQYYKFHNFFGTPGTLPNTTKLIGQGGAIMTNLAVPKIDRCAFVEPDVKVEMAEQIKTLYMQDKATSALERTKLGPIHNFDSYESASLIRHTAGNWAGTILVKGASQKVAYSAVKSDMKQNLIVDGFTAAAQGIKKGDVFTIAGVYEVNPGTHQSTGRLRRFTVLADVATVTSGTNQATLSISPPIIPLDSATVLDQANATVTTTPADNAAVTVLTGTSGSQYVQNLLMHKNAISLVMKPLQRLESFTVWEQTNHKGLSLTLSKGGDIYTHTEVWRLDALFGVEVVQPELGIRLTS